MATLESLNLSRLSPPFQFPTKLNPTSTPKLFFKSPLFTPISRKFQACLSSAIQHEVTEEEEEEENLETTQKEDNGKKLLFVLNLPWSFSVADVKNLLGECGPVADVEIINCEEHGKRGFAFVTVSSGEEALAAIKKLDSHDLFKVEYAKKATPPNELFADSHSRVVFSPSSGYGLLSFASKEEAESAISAFNHSKVKLSEYIANNYVILFFDLTPTAHHQDFGVSVATKPITPPSSSLISLPVPPKPPSTPPPISATNTHLQEKLLYLDSFGIDLIPLLTTHPPLISTSLSHIKSTISFLSSTIPLAPPALHRLISLCPEVLTLPLPSIISTITFLLREANVRTHHLRRVIHRRPRLLASDVKTRLRPTLYFLQGTIGISEINKHAHLLSSSVEDKLLPRIQYFNEKIGISYDDTILIFRRFPSLFCYSIKDNLEPKFNYFVVEMGRDLKELVEFPQYFSFSLENRIKPRHRRCVEKSVCLPLPGMLRLSEKRFLERLEECCGSSMPVRNSPFWYYTHHSDY
ncbi:uncharacterized protein LOC112513541 [Cynara cardunculus var. scolymus]|uniref:RRM domain-containing protein n=1 Tax=Cynara cardunculus var. scolymus TaxID=59895 RepID=A0A103Y6E9_CYNCS|nr:uncharacterized protein LOC112513541 [Cynara cardunculus var. scolymus]KVI03366.1 hypothetical protein Ccrd_018338 [Cynara cardunculus var. scolymus]